MHLMVIDWSGLCSISLKTWASDRGIIPLCLKFSVVPVMVNVFPAPVCP